MSNHAHMLIQTENLQALSKYMQRLNTKYGKYYNKKYTRVGYVFRDRYKAEGIYNERYLYNCLKYIYDNPVKAGMCEKAEDYPYSNYKKIEEKLDETYKFMDVEEDNKKITEDIIKRFLKENNMELPALKKDKTKLRGQIIELLSNRIIIVGVLLMVLFCLLIYRLFVLQIILFYFRLPCTHLSCLAVSRI